MPKEVYAFRNNKQNMQKATSGGAFIALADAFFKKCSGKQAHVYGVTYDQELNVHYDMADTLKDCERFSGSKYVRSDNSGVFERIKDDLNGGMAVLFTGTPCNVAALQKFLCKYNINQENLFCIDLICHGTPQPIYWEAYREWLQKKYKSTLVDFKFRTHGEGTSGYTCSATFKNGKRYVNIPETQIYNRMFLRHYLFPKGCFKCKFANLNRRGDVTIGDFWGIEKAMTNFPYTKDVSEILVNSAKGKQLVDIIINCAQRQGYCIELCSNEEYVQYQNNLQQPASEPSDYDLFQKDFQDKGIRYVAAKYVGYDWLHRVKFFLLRR